MLFTPKKLPLIAILTIAIIATAEGKNLKKKNDNMDPNFLFMASHGKRSGMEASGAFDEDEDNVYMRAQRYFINRPNSLIFYKPSASPEIGKRDSGDMLYLPRPNNFLSPMRGKRYRSPNSFNFPLLSAQDWLMASELNAAANPNAEEPAMYDIKYGKRKDDGAFETFLGSRG